jgi:hypothetical protein
VLSPPKIEIYIKECFRQIQTGHRGADVKNKITTDVRRIVAWGYDWTQSSRSGYSIWLFQTLKLTVHFHEKQEDSLTS